MFTGIIKSIATIEKINLINGLMKLSIKVDPTLLIGLEKGASIALNGTCLTVVDFDSQRVSFDLIPETVDKTTFKNTQIGQQVNFERSARFGDEIGGHFLSGHVTDTVTVDSVQQHDSHWVVIFQGSPSITRYLFPKGYVALNGASLTLVDVDTQKHTFSVHLIPETVSRTTFSSILQGSQVNIEIDSHTQATVDTMIRLIDRQAGGQDFASSHTASPTALQREP